MKARSVHGSRYDYSNILYVNSSTKVKIACIQHGVFEQTPGNHLQGMGCLLCGFQNAGQYHKKDTKSFIAEAKAIHGNRYDYSSTQYKGAREKLTIVCPKHGAFEQVAHVHICGETGAGCEICSYEERGERARLSFQEFVHRANAIHKGFYNYSYAEKNFIDTATKVSISCPIHGPYSQAPSLHMAGQGCPTCGTTRAANTMRKTTASFIEQAALIHEGKYDYSEVIYEGAFVNVAIVCPLDGVFLQSPTSHLSGIGCPRCSRRKQGAPRNLTRALRGEFDDSKEAFVYIVSFRLSCASVELHKVGSGTGSRMKTVVNDIRRVGGQNLKIVHYPFSSTGEAIVFEHLAHEQVREHQFIVPFDFKFHGHSEVFIKSPNVAEVETQPSLARFRLGHRWDPRVTIPEG